MKNGYFSCYWDSEERVIFITADLFKKSFRNTIRVSSSLDPDHDRSSVGPCLGPKC